MGQVLPLTPTVQALVRRAEATPKLWQAGAATDRATQLQPLLRDLAAGMTKSDALAVWAAANGKSAATGRRWLEAYLAGGATALMPHWRRPQNLAGLEALILRLHNQGSRPNCGTIARWIEDQTGVRISAGKIRRYIASLPAIAGAVHPDRLGRHEYRMKVQPYVERDASVFAFGEALHADGHCMKIWCLHPASGRPFRAEFTPLLDIRSNFLWDFWLAEAESANGTIFALCRMVQHWHHAPAIFYTDPGPGFNNERVHTLLERLGTTHMISRAGNSRGRGFGEGFFHLFIERFAKRYQSCCSRDRTDDTLARFETKWKHGEIYVPPFADVQQDLLAFQQLYNRTPQPYSRRLAGKAPQDLKGDWQPSGIDVPIEMLVRPSRILTVRGGALRTLHRRYIHRDLLAYERRKVEVQFDLADLERIWVYDPDGRYVCEAPCIAAQPYVQPTFLEEARAKSDAAKLKLLQKHANEVKARSARVLTPAAVVDALEAPAVPVLPTLAVRLLDGGQHIVPPTPVAPPRTARPVAPAALAQLQAEAAADAAELASEAETPDRRLARALALQRQQQAGTTLTEAEARWLAIYTASPEYHSRIALLEECDGNPPEMT